MQTKTPLPTLPLKFKLLADTHIHTHVLLEAQNAVFSQNAYPGQQIIIILKNQKGLIIFMKGSNESQNRKEKNLENVQIIMVTVEHTSLPKLRL